MEIEGIRFLDPSTTPLTFCKVVPRLPKAIKVHNLTISKLFSYIINNVTGGGKGERETMMTAHYMGWLEQLTRSKHGMATLSCTVDCKNIRIAVSDAGQ